MARRVTDILIVDDDPAARQALERLLAGEGFSVTSAPDGETALEIAARTVPDVVVTDLMMPGMDGMGLLAALRTSHLEMPVILATAVGDPSTVLAAIHEGAADYLTKPIDGDALIFAIHRALRTRDLVSDAKALRARNEKLAADAARTLRAREELLSILAHDLRGPLSTITLAANTLQPTDDPATVMRTWEVVQRAATRMTRLVEDFLDVTRIETGSLVLDLAPQHASALLREVVSLLEPAAAEAGVQLTTTLTEDFSVHCAFERIVQVMVNLASNALDVTPRDRGVRLLAERRADVAWFAVEDDGPGISTEHLAHIFERGWRLDAGRHKGAGLGLAIAKGIVEAHGGAVSVESTVGVGTKFHFEVPLSGPARTSWRLTPPWAEAEQ